MKNKIAFRLLFPVLLIVVASMALTAYVIYESDKDNIADAMLNDMKSIVSITRHNLSFWMREQISTAKTLASNKELIQYLKEHHNEELLYKVEDNLKRFYKHSKFYENIAVVIKLPKGEYIERKIANKNLKIYNANTIIDTLGGKTVTRGSLEMPFLKNVLINGAVSISKPYPSPVRQNPIVAIAVPIKSKNQIIGALILAIKLSYFVEKYIQNIDIAKQGFIAAVDSSGDVIIHKNKKFILNKNIKETPFGKEILANDQLEGVFELNGEKVYVDSQKDTITSWHIVGHVFEKNIYEKQQNYALKIAFIFFLITVLLTYFLYKIISYIVIKPLKELAKRLDDFSIENTQILEEFTTSIDEFSKIKDSFNDAATLLSISYLNLQYSQNLSRSVLNSIDALIFYQDKNLEYIGFNNKFAEFLNKEDSEIVGKNDFDLFDDTLARELVETDLQILKTGKSITTITTVKYPNSKEVILQRIKSLLKDKEGNIIGVVGVAYDITKQKELEKVIEHQAYYDTLTQLPNRAFLYEYFEKNLAIAQREKKQLALLFIDLDHFKYINDTFGHDVGDEVLKILASRFNSVTRKSDIISRHGGDEFIIIYNNYQSMQDLLAYANKLVSLATQECVVNQHSFLLSVSIGISIYPEHGNNQMTLMRHADTAMYKAKEMGRNNIQFFEVDMSQKVQEEMTMLNSIRLAIDKEEFFLLYQPQIDAKSLELIGVEALVRWNSKDFGLVYPDRFIPLSESTGMILPLGEWILRKACEQQVTWKKEYGNSIRVAVNVSIRQFQHNNFLQSVVKIVKETGIDPEKLELEITEGISMKDVNKSLTILNGLKELGISISIDDFGTGYSSLAYLKKFPIDKLKIDKAFVLESIYDKDDRVLMETIIMIAKGLGIKSVAEGVEERAHLELLKELSCDILQGFYFDKALHFDELQEKYF